MRVVFHIISTGGGSGTSRATRYIAERDKDPEREGPDARPLFSEDRDNLTYRKADRILDPVAGQPDKDDITHLSVSFHEEDFEKLGGDEQERQAGLRRVIREGMKGMADELNVEGLTWVAGIHRNTENPHAHIVFRNAAVPRGEIAEKQIGRLRSSLLPHKQMVDGREVIVPGRIGDRFLTALDRQQERFRDQKRARDIDHWEQLSERAQGRKPSASREGGHSSEHVPDDNLTRQFKQYRNVTSTPAVDSRSIAGSWKRSGELPRPENLDYRIALGRHLEFSTRLAFAEIWYERAAKHGDTYRFQVIDQSTSEERKISELDVHRRASARAQRISPVDRSIREQAYETDLSDHRETLDRLMEARETKIAALGKDLVSMRGTVSKVEQRLFSQYEAPSGKRMVPMLSRETLSELQNTAVRLNLPDRMSELERVRLSLAREFRTASRTDEEAATLAAQRRVAQADLKARDARLENFEASLHLTPYEVHGERWSLGTLDKQIARRREDAKLIPDRAARLDLRSLTRINYSSTARQEANAEVEHLLFVRGEVVRQIEQRHEPLIADRDLAREMAEVLDETYSQEKRTHERRGETMPDANYQRHQINSLETSAEILRDAELLREVHNWEKSEGRNDSEHSWEGRALAREILSEIAVAETRDRLQHFLESKRVASLNLGDHKTGTLREVEARTLTDYVVRAIESRQQRDHRYGISLAAREHHGRLVSDFEKSKDYHAAAHDLASEARGSDPQFTDKEKINLEIYAERQIDETTRQQLLALTRDDEARDRDVAHSR